MAEMDHHRPLEDVMGLYAEAGWRMLCDQVRCVRIGLLKGKVIQLHPTAKAEG